MQLKLSTGTANYERIGKGFPVILLHGGPGDLRHMLGLMEPIFERQSGWCRYYLDMPGCGSTRTDDSVDSYDRGLEFVLNFVDKIVDQEPVILVGYSYGGYMVRGVLHHRPDQIAGICLIAPRILQDRDKKQVPNHQVIISEPGFSEALKPGEEWFSNFLVEQTVAGAAALRHHFLPGLEQYDQAHSERMNSLSPGLSFDVDDLPGPFTRPALIITGRQDSVTGYQDAWKLLDIYPRATYAVLDSAGHFLGLVEASEPFRALVSDWLNRVRSSLGAPGAGQS